MKSNLNDYIVIQCMYQQAILIFFIQINYAHLIHDCWIVMTTHIEFMYFCERAIFPFSDIHNKTVFH